MIKKQKIVILFAAGTVIMMTILMIACDVIPVTAYPHSNKTDPLYSEGSYKITIIHSGEATGESLISIPPTGDAGDIIILEAALLNSGRLVNLNAVEAETDPGRILTDGGTASFVMPATDVNVTAGYGVKNLETILHASDAQSDDRFGTSVSISGDYMIVGANQEDGGSGVPISDAGAAYIYERDSVGVWIEKAVLHASDAQVSDYFGYSVSISGDYAVVGAFSEDGGSGDPASNAGAAYIYERDTAGVWSEKAVLHASDAQVDDYFGYSVSISGNYAVIGAWQEDGGSGDPSSNAGAAYVYERYTGGVWTERAILHATDAQALDSFGYSVSISGFFVLIGASSEDGGNGDPAIGAGAAYIYERDTVGVWIEKAVLHASDAQVSDYFGYSVNISGDYAVVGAYSEDGGSGDPASNAGAAYIYERDTAGVWSEKAILHASDAQEVDQFGSSVSISGNYALIGAWREDGGSGDPALGAGAAYIYERGLGGSWSEIVILNATDAQTADNFGSSVGISGYSAVAGAPAEDGGSGDSALEAGAAYIIENIAY